MLNSLRLNGLVVEPLTQLADALEGQGSLGPWYFAAFFVLWATVGLPVTPLEILCGFVFGAPRAVLVVTLAKLGGCVAGFSVSRHFFRGSVIRWLDKHKTRFRALHALASELETHPFRTVCLLRLAPLPLAAKNYGLGAFPQCDVATFSAATLAVNLPMTVVWTVTGARATSLVDALAASASGDASGDEALVVPSSLGAYALLLGAGTVVSSYVVARISHRPHAD